MVRSLLLAVLAVGGQSSDQCEDAGDVLKDETSLLQLHRRELMGRALQSETTAGHAVEESLGVFISRRRRRRSFSDSDCWGPCGEQSGWCDWCTRNKGFQGQGMACCRAGQNDAFPCHLTDPLDTHHVCRSPWEYDCWEDCGKTGGHCSACGKNRACCRTDQDGTKSACTPKNVIDGAIPMLHPQIISEQHVCRDTKYPEGGGMVKVTDVERREYQPGEFDCFPVCNRQSGYCKMCGPDPYKPYTNRVCCRPDHNAGAPECGGTDTSGLSVTKGHTPQHVCRSSLPPAPPPPPPRPPLGTTKGYWVRATEDYFLGSEAEIEFTRGVSMENGGSDEKSVFNEVSHSVETGFSSPVGPSLTVGFSSSTGTEITTSSSWSRAVSEERSFSQSFQAEAGRHLWQWMMNSTNKDVVLTDWIIQTKHVKTKPACVPKHFAWGDGSSANGAQFCQYGFRLDGTGGDAGFQKDKCQGRPQLDATNIGVADEFRGWYDVTGCGEALDFCRWTSPSSEGDPKDYIQKFGSFWKCLLSDGDDVSGIHLPGWTDNIAGPRPKRSPDTNEMVEQRMGEKVAQQYPISEEYRVWQFLKLESAPAPPPPPPPPPSPSHDQDDHYYW